MSYVISLDEIDLNYLPLSKYEKGENTKPLFDISHPISNTYVQFQIIPSTDDEDHNEYTLNTTICHICNIEIPRCYFTEHIQSSKHRTFKSITESALARVKKSLSDDNFVMNEVQPFSSYFCVICSLVLPEKEKGNHEISQQHCEELKKESQLADLLCLYTAEKAEDERYQTALSLDLNGHIDEVEDDPKINQVFHINKPETNNITAVTKHIVKDCDFESKETIVLPYGTAVKVSFENYHGFVLISESLKFCLLCQKFVQNTMTSEHISSEKHNQQASISTRDINCIRTIANDIFHCILCNEIITDVNAHIGNIKHSAEIQVIEQSQKTDFEFEFEFEHFEYQIKTAQDIVSKKYNCFDSSDCEQLHCKVCEIDIPEESALKHTNSSIHVTKYKDVLLPNCTMMLGDEGNLRGTICKTDCVNRGMELPHIEGEKHKTDVIEDKVEAKSKLATPNESGSTKLFEGGSSESGSGISLSNKNVFFAITNSKNIERNPKLAKEQLPTGIETTKDTHTVSCRICQVKLPNTYKNITEHIISAKHNTKYKDILDKNNVENLKTGAICRVCNAVIDFNYFDHIETITHVNNLTRSSSPATKEVADVTKPNFVVRNEHCKKCLFTYSRNSFVSFLHDIKHDVNVKKLLKKPILASKLYHCDACAEDVYNDVYSYKTHMLQHMLRKHKALNQSTYCSKCDMHVPKTPITEDLHQLLHYPTAAPEPNVNGAELYELLNTFYRFRNRIVTVKRYEYYCDTCHVYIQNNDSLKIHNDSLEHVINKVKKMEGFEYLLEENYKKELQCKICTKNIGKYIEIILQHFQGKKHKTNYTAFLNKNEIAISKGILFCKKCDVLLEPMTEIHHVETLNHKVKLQT